MTDSTFHIHKQPADDDVIAPASHPLVVTELALLKQQLATLKQGRRPFETATIRIVLVQDALLHKDDADLAIAPAILATLQHELAIAYLDQNVGRSKDIENAIFACNEALRFYTRTLYPQQYAHLQITLGNAYRERVVEGQRANLERAIACYQDALLFYTPHDFPYEHALALHELALTYQSRIEGERRANLEAAIACCEQALAIRTADVFPLEQAQTLQALGTAYFLRVAGERRDNLELAINACRQAATFFTLEAFPVEYARGQHNLAAFYSQRIEGEQRDNIEMAIAYYHEVLRVYTLATFPTEYGRAQNNLGILYWQRVQGERRDNLELAIACYSRAAAVFTEESAPYQHAMLQNNLGAVYVVRILGKRADNLELAIACYQTALRIWTREAFPYQYAKAQNNLGEAFQHRLAGVRRDNLELAIACYQESLHIWTLEASAQDHAMLQRNLGTTYQLREVGERQANLALALAAHRASLGVYTLHAFPIEHRDLQLDCAETLALLTDWAGVHAAYSAARKAEDLLFALGAGAFGRDAVLKAGRDAAARDGFALAQLDQAQDAALAIESGRARGLAEAIQFNAADPARIGNDALRERYKEQQQTFITAQAALQAAPANVGDENAQRQLLLERTATYRLARTALDAVIAEIRLAHDPADFFMDTLDAATIVEAVEHCGAGHALVYLAATPWGGVAVAVFADNPDRPTTARFATRILPALTDTFLNTLIETRLDADSVTGGFDVAQRGGAYQLLRSWPGATFREQATSLHHACLAGAHTGTLAGAAHYLLSLPPLAAYVDQPAELLNEEERSLLSETLNHALLQRELQRCQALLGEVVLHPLIEWLRETDVMGLTLVPCGPLAAFPLEGTFLQDGRTLGETLPTSVAPSARSLLRKDGRQTRRSGVYTLGNPYPTRQQLRWGEAEAFTLAELGNRPDQPAGVRVQWQATRKWLLEVLHTGHVVEVSCHGTFEAGDFLRSRLMLANDEDLTLADMLSYQSDLHGLRLLILSACQTAILDLQGAQNEVRSLAVGMLQAGATAVLAALWAVDDRATYLLMVRFALEWFPHMYTEPPAAALARAQQWLRSVTNADLQQWQALTLPLAQQTAEPFSKPAPPIGELVPADATRIVAVRGRANRFDSAQAQEIMQASAEEQDLSARPYADPYYWSGFQITGW